MDEVAFSSIDPSYRETKGGDSYTQDSKGFTSDQCSRLGRFFAAISFVVSADENPNRAQATILGVQIGSSAFNHGCLLISSEPWPRVVFSMGKHHNFEVTWVRHPLAHRTFAIFCVHCTTHFSRFLSFWMLVPRISLTSITKGPVGSHG